MLWISCKNRNPINPLELVLTSNHPKIKKVMDSVISHEVQIRYTRINRKNDSVVFTEYDYQVNDKTYFYPASTVKLLTAVLTLEKLNTIDTLTKNTRFYIEGDTLETTFANEIIKIFAVSDNASNNRLVEFLGQNEINDKLKSKGIDGVRISHRLSTANADEITTKPLVIYLNDSTTSTTSTIINTSAIPLGIKGVLKGKGFMEDGLLQKEPFDMSLKNHYSIAAQHNVLKRIVFPKQFNETEQFQISETQYEFLLRAMSNLPKDAGYDSEIYHDNYGKFFIYGDSKENIPDYIKIYNKIGFAYGTVTDCAYIVDSKNNVEFMVTATLLVNKNGIFNDNTYEFEEIGLPFLAQLGRELYNYELNNQ
ncbi:MAG: hypothetical protein COA50_06645 [Flavobacteriaceae bacterium]|nr:MAG: hypothetical protein COA50_06645 [Flavobacteriaceae bacterium]